MSVTPADNSKDLAMDVQALGRLRQSARQNSPQALKESARQFEALFLNTMLKSMREASPQGDLSGGQDGKFYTAMLDQQLSQTMSQRGIGLADYLLRQMTPMPPPTRPPRPPLCRHHRQSNLQRLRQPQRQPERRRVRFGSGPLRYLSHPW